jgi:hypothetical protein
MKKKQIAQPPEVPLLDYYTTESRKRYSSGVEGIIDFGRCLIEAKSKLLPADWKRFTETDRCPVSLTVATRYMRIAESPHILNAENWTRLPIGWNLLYQISLLTQEQFDNGIQHEQITPTVTLKKLRELAGNSHKTKTRRQILPEMKAAPTSDPVELKELGALLPEPENREQNMPTTSKEPNPRKSTLQEPGIASSVVIKTVEAPASAQPEPATSARKAPTTSRSKQRDNGIATPETFRLIIVLHGAAASQVNALRAEIDQMLSKLSFNKPEVYLDNAA